jgi:hypothetical protein
MEPYLKDLTDKVIVVRINADDNQSLCKELKIDALPVLLLYKNQTLVLKNAGYIDKADVCVNFKYLGSWSVGGRYRGKMSSTTEREINRKN